MRSARLEIEEMSRLRGLDKIANAQKLLRVSLFVEFCDRYGSLVVDFNDDAALELSVVVGCPEKRNEDHQQDGAANHSRSDDYSGRQAH